MSQTCPTSCPVSSIILCQTRPFPIKFCAELGFDHCLLLYLSYFQCEFLLKPIAKPYSQLWIKCMCRVLCHGVKNASWFLFIWWQSLIVISCTAKPLIFVANIFEITTKTIKKNTHLINKQKWSLNFTFSQLLHASFLHVILYLMS